MSIEARYIAGKTELAIYLGGVGRRFVETLISKGLPVIKTDENSSKYLFRKDLVDDFLDQYSTGKKVDDNNPFLQKIMKEMGI